MAEINNPSAFKTMKNFIVTLVLALGAMLFSINANAQYANQTYTRGTDSLYVAKTLDVTATPEFKAGQALYNKGLTNITVGACLGVGGAIAISCSDVTDYDQTRMCCLIGGIVSSVGAIVEIIGWSQYTRGRTAMGNARFRFNGGKAVFVF